jgi:hypothetical protein
MDQRKSVDMAIAQTAGTGGHAISLSWNYQHSHYTNACNTTMLLPYASAYAKRRA